jgi:hypothetical protein
MAIDTTPPRTRRAILAGALGAAAAVGIDAVARPRPAAAISYVVLGGDNSETTGTRITNTTTDVFRVAFKASASGLSNGVEGQSDAGVGVSGISNSGNAVVGSSTSGMGVFAEGDAGGALGRSNVGNGVIGYTYSAAASGVYGEGKSGGYGVAGRSNAGPFSGTAATLGENTAYGIGVWARAAHGVGLFAEAVHPDAIALKADGATQFKRSGILTIGAGTATVTKTGIRIDAGTLVLTTLQQNRTGVWIQSAVPNASGDSFTIRLNKVVAGDTKVAWFLVN